MTDPTCRDCKKNGLVWGKTKAGKAILMELRPHFISCPKRPKVEDPLPVLALMDLGIKVMEARRLVKGLRGDDAAILEAALQRMDQERGQ